MLKKSIMPEALKNISKRHTHADFRDDDGQAHGGFVNRLAGKLKRQSITATMVPRMVAMMVVTKAMVSEFTMASKIDWLFQAFG